MERRLFQLVIAVLSLIPVMDFVNSALNGASYLFPEGGLVPNDLDNQYRYLAGVYLSVTIAIWWTLGNVEERVVPIRIVCAGIFIGGLMRIQSIATVGMPEFQGFLAGIFIEVILVPLLLWWQVRLRRKAGVT